MTIQAILTLALAILALEMKPGPGMMMLMSRTISQGMAGCMTYMLGYIVVTLGYLFVVLFGFQVANVDILFIAILVKSLAAVYLIWMGVKGLQSLSDKLSLQDIEGEGFFDTLTSAMMVTVSNPLVIIFYAGILPTLVDVNAMTFNDIIAIIGVVVIVGGGFPILYCLPLALFRKRMSDNFLRGLKFFSSVVIILVGVYIGYTAILSEDLLSVF